MRTRSNRSYRSNPWPSMTFDWTTLMRQAPATSSADHRPNSRDSPSSPSSESSSSPSSPSSPSPPPSARAARAAPSPRRHMSRFRPPRSSSDLVLRNVAVLGVMLAVALMFLHLALYVAIFVVAVLAPAWQTFKAIQADDQPVIVEVDDDDQQIISEPRHLRNWQTYWVIAAGFLALDAFLLAPFKPLLPTALYRAAMLSLVTWLTKNSAGNSAALFDCYVRPALQRSESTIDGAVDVALTHIDHASKQAILALNEAVAPYARQLERAAATTTARIQEQAHAQDRALGGGRQRRNRR